MLQYSVLASGSTGNAIYIGTERHHFLIDAGLSGKKVEDALSKIGIGISEINGVFITHEHDDHVKGIGVLARKYKIPVYANSNTLDSLPKSVGAIEESLIHRIDTGSILEFGPLAIESFPISHDAKEPVGYVFYRDKYKVSLVTDLGYVSSKIKEKIKGSDALIFEANHDIEMLRVSSYPWSIKQRILSDVGHLSNEAAGEALAEIITNNTQQVLLAHLSKENNLPELAHLAVRNILEDHGITDKDIHLLRTYFDKPTDLYRLESHSNRSLILK